MKKQGHNEEEKKKPWPTKDVMEQIYEMNLWGGEDGDFYSGLGSHDPEIVIPYVDIVSEFLSSFKEPLTVLDLGCGDFNVGSRLVRHTGKYIAVDIVKILIERNKKKFKDKRLEFICTDIAKEDLPEADCIILRQVLQHLSNAEIQRIVDKLYDYKYVLLTEHIPDFDYVPNKNIISGQGIRLKKESGVNVLAPPFNLKPKEAEEFLVSGSDKGRGVLTTVCFKMK